MGRGGRIGRSPEFQALLGNPGHRTRHRPKTPLDPLPTSEILPPSFLTSDREIALFQSVVRDPAMRALLRPTDAFALARWCTYQHFWELFEDTPTKKILEGMMRALERRLGLNPIDRMRLMNGVADHS